MPMIRTAWEDSATKAAICGYFMIVLSFLSALLAVRLYSVGSFRGFVRLRLARQLIVFTLLDSWLFCWASAVILFGVGSALNHTACEIGIWWCIACMSKRCPKLAGNEADIPWLNLAVYASSKAMIYLFLMERLNVVHSSIQLHDGVTLKDRFRSWWYRISAVLLVSWIAVGIVMCFGRNATLNSDGTCKIGLKIWSTVPMLTADAVINIFLTAGFIVPVLKSGFNKARTLVRTSCIAAVVALVTSFANILILAIMKGHQHSWLCLTSCVTDVAINAAILFFITRYGKQDELSASETAMAASKRTGEALSSGRAAGITSCDRDLASRRVSWAISNQHAALGTATTHSLAFEGIVISRIQECSVDVEKDFEKDESGSEASSSTPTIPTQVTRSFGSISAAERQAIAPFSHSMIEASIGAHSSQSARDSLSRSANSRKGSTTVS